MKPYRDERSRPQQEPVPVLDLSCAYGSVDDLLWDLNGETAELQGKAQDQNQPD